VWILKFLPFFLAACSHIYCRNCLLRTQLVKAQCPICRADASTPAETLDSYLQIPVDILKEMDPTYDERLELAKVERADLIRERQQNEIRRQVFYFLVFSFAFSFFFFYHSTQSNFAHTVTFFFCCSNSFITSSSDHSHSLKPPTKPNLKSLALVLARFVRSSMFIYFFLLHLTMPKFLAKFLRIFYLFHCPCNKKKKHFYFIF
jgi:hypothetical protein